MQKADNGQSICDGNLLHTSVILNDPFFLPVELDKDENRPVQPKLSTKMELKVRNQIYDLTAIIYHHSAHFWCKKLVTSTGYKQGWYLYNDMWNNGQAKYVGKHPQVDTLAYMHML